MLVNLQLGIQDKKHQALAPVVVDCSSLVGDLPQVPHLWLVTSYGGYSVDTPYLPQVESAQVAISGGSILFRRTWR